MKTLSEVRRSVALTKPPWSSISSKGMLLCLSLPRRQLNIGCASNLGEIAGFMICIPSAAASIWCSLHAALSEMMEIDCCSCSKWLCSMAWPASLPALCRMSALPSRYAPDA